MNPQFHKGVVEMCVLALVLHNDRYGYELVDAISKELPISEGTIYPILRRLTTEGYFETYLVESSGGPPRKYYRMTSQGRAFTEGTMKEWSRFNKSVGNLLSGATKK